MRQANQASADDAVSTRPRATLRHRLRCLRSWDAATLGAIAVVAFLVRLLPVLRGGGLGGYGRYDDGVYFTAADSLIHGRLPYRDFVLLHPPGLTLLLSPFAELGRLTSDATGYEVARVAFMTVGALNAVLVAVIARRWGRAAGLVAGGIYAVWWAAIYTEESTVLEPLGTTALLVALGLLLKRPRTPSRRAELLSGAALGAAVTLKIWYLGPWVAICLWQLAVRRWRSAAMLVAAGAATIVVIVLPFFLLAPTRMFDMVVRDQLLRPSLPGSPRSDRLQFIFSIRQLLPNSVHISITTATGLFLVLVGLAVVGCLFDVSSRVLIYVFLVNFGILLASPSFFGHYAHLAAAPTALVLGVGGTQLVGRVRFDALHAAAAVLVAMACCYSAYRVLQIRVDRPVKAAKLADAAPSGCVASDNPELLILMNKLSSDLSASCPVAVDVSGVTYDFAHRTLANGRPVPRYRNAAWNQYLYGYLSSARSFVFIRPEAGVSAATLRAIAAHRVLATSDGVDLRAGAR
jgi:alpha-1,2-mannosyltransferase